MKLGFRSKIYLGIFSPLLLLGVVILFVVTMIMTHRDNVGFLLYRRIINYATEAWFIWICYYLCTVFQPDREGCMTKPFQNHLTPPMGFGYYLNVPVWDVIQTEIKNSFCQGKNRLSL